MYRGIIPCDDLKCSSNQEFHISKLIKIWQLFLTILNRLNIRWSAWDNSFGRYKKSIVNQPSSRWGV